MYIPGRRTREGGIAGAVGAAVLLASLLVLPGGEGSACAQVSARWTQLNAWPSQALLRPFALLLQTC